MLHAAGSGGMGKKNKKKTKKRAPGPNDTPEEIPRHLREPAPLENTMAHQILAQRGAEAIVKEIEAKREAVEVPSVDIHRVITQMDAERSASPIARGEGSYAELTRYGLFLKAAREELAQEIPKADSRLRVAVALCNRTFRDASVLDAKRATVERASKHLTWLTTAVNKLNEYLSEFQASPYFVQGVAELMARDLVQPGWDSTESFNVTRSDDDDQIADDMSFEELLALEKANQSAQNG